MITRRKFVKTSMAASAVTLLGCRQDTAVTPPEQGAANAELRLYFVGGTVFVNDNVGLMGLQLSGKGQSYGGRSLEHESYIAGPSEFFPGGVELPALTGPLGQQFALASFKAECLVKKTIVVDGGKNEGAKNNCDRLANYGHVAGGWERKPEWDPKKNAAINSIFKLKDGGLYDEQAVNKTAANVKWWVKDRGKQKDLSDIAVLDLKAPKITVSGATTNPIILEQGKKLALYVFSGPLHLHEEGHKYKTITHALLLKTIYDVKGTPDADIMPTTANEIDGEMGEEMKNPCNDKVKIRVPPDSEYCPNYDELP